MTVGPSKRIGDFENLTSVAATDKILVQTATVTGNATPAQVFSAVTDPSFTTLTVTGTVTFGTPLPVTGGGTGSATASAARTALGLAIGSDVQAFSTELSGVAALASTGMAARTAAGTYAARTIAGTANEITLTNGDGVSGAPTVSIPTALTFTGKTVTGGTYASPTITTSPTAAGATWTDLGTVTTMVLSGGTISGVTINNSAIGGSTPAAGAFTTLSSSGIASLADITLTAANPEILGGDADGITYLSGGASTALGSSIRLHGNTHATLADDFMVYGSGTLQAHYDDSASTWDFQANAITTTGAAGFGVAAQSSAVSVVASRGLHIPSSILGAPSTNGLTIDYAAPNVRFAPGAAGGDYIFYSATISGEIFRLANSGLATFAGDINFSQANPEILGGDADGELFIGPSTTNALGGNLILYGQSHATKANDIEFRATTTTQLGYDDSASTWDFANNEASQITLKDYAEKVNAIGGSGGGTQDFDLTLGNVASVTVDTSANTFTFSNPSASGTTCSLTLIITNGGSQTVNWPAAVDWAGGTAPTLTASGRDVISFITIDGGTIWYGFAGGLAMA